MVDDITWQQWALAGWKFKVSFWLHHHHQQQKRIAREKIKLVLNGNIFLHARNILRIQIILKCFSYNVQVFCALTIMHIYYFLLFRERKLVYNVNMLFIRWYKLH